ncbi:MAG: hypothetical protein WCX65_14940 [bacterium]
MAQIRKLNMTPDEKKQMELIIDAEQFIEPIKQKIRAECPNVEISVLASGRDNIGGVLYVRNVPTELVSRIRVSVDYVMVQLDDRAATDIIIVPIPDSELGMRPRVSDLSAGF